ncbi:bifunctional 4-hydroxy-2-oxoglutarate aldolase/2-dehydro-3-deoxy-phosphogluconate aldolase [Microbacterium stercoris]|uniref:Bifunctional 4-hydroxy-2-oxoglutarate aldolase/2-dehydro-3-deoxy-phosphogluconate aldolase n=1 Tax=Microbacterium stercoris TaxID=2820289 RepID=A0A939TQ43_9MICO|nr:bifunctional 4-hydroxy-2-oxoglutarate aldolase/2-dehydro-3-deoxy-phosphogluconate aldolase [Microbacterium stercoris]MBO3662761.1 bifunctional 4-hydroxy-2-oxoglutarate aldolase/2-dehydro-3-deoxy-phosphogluconate aldolase [Microbacterium stercoris]
MTELSQSVLDGQRLVPLAAPANPAQTEALREGLIAGGLPIVEVGLRNAYAATALAELAAAGGLIVGAGTVLDGAQAVSAIDAGAQFLVTPGYADDIVEVAQRRGIPIVPGTATATEVLRARQAGLRFVKLFPANVLGGLSLINALSAAFTDMRFMPSGGVTQATLVEHLSHPAVGAVSGSWLTSGALLDKGADAVAEVVRASVALAATVQK